MARTPHLGSGIPGEAVSLSGGFIRAVSSAPDVLTIQGHSTQVGDLLCVGTHNADPTSDANEKFTISKDGTVYSKLKPIVEVGSGSTAYTVLSSNSGKAHIVPGFSSGATITLPAHDDGLNYEFYIRAVTASGGLSFVPASSPGSIVYGSVTDAASIVAATAADLIGGAKFSMLSDGTNWYMSYADAGSTAAALITVAASDA
jgi:hypothetical protein